MSPTMAELLTAAQLADLLQVSLRHVRRLDSAGLIPAPVRIGRKAVRWNVSELEAWVKAGTPDRKAWNAMKARPQLQTRSLVESEVAR